MKKYLIICCLFLGEAVISQVGVGTENPHTTAALELMSSDKGLLITRLTNTAMNNLSQPATGLVVYNTDLKGFYGFDGTRWTQEVFTPYLSWDVNGNNSGTWLPIIGTRDFTNFSFATNGKKALTALTTGQVDINGPDLQKPRLYIAPAQKDTQFPAMFIYTAYLNYTGAPFSTTVVSTNDYFTDSNSTGVMGNYAFAASKADAETGNSAAGMSYVKDKDVNGISFYIGGHPANTEDRSKEVMILANTRNVGIGTHVPKAKLHIGEGDLYIADPNKGLIVKDPAGNCRRITVNDTGNLVASGQISCP